MTKWTLLNNFIDPLFSWWERNWPQLGGIPHDLPAVIHFDERYSRENDFVDIDDMAEEYHDDSLDAVDDGVEETFACGAAPSVEDEIFFTAVGVIEDFMFTVDLPSRVGKLPPYASLSDHDRHAAFTTLVRRVEADLEAVLTSAMPNVSMAQITAEVSRRREDIAEEVVEFFTEGCLDYPTFAELWKSLDVGAQ